MGQLIIAQSHAICHLRSDSFLRILSDSSRNAPNVSYTYLGIDSSPVNSSDLQLVLGTVEIIFSLIIDNVPR
jgi:hypothetical protein